MAEGKTVTFALSTGAKVTAPKALAQKLGWSEPKPKPAEKK